MERKEIILDEWQKEMLQHEGDLLLCTGRQVGKTTIMAHKAGKYMIDHPNSQIIVVSLTEDQAQLMIIMILTFLEQNHRKEIALGKKRPTKSTITLKNGAKVIARPVGNTGDAVRGFTGDVLIVDEASRMPELMWIAAKPTLLTTGGKIWMCSTPHGKEGFFYDCFQNKDEKYKVFHISSEEVIKNRPISESWTKERREGGIQILEREKQEMSELRYAQEYLGMFVDDLRRLFSDELIDRTCILQPRESVTPNRTYSLGVDIARMGDDESTFEVLEKQENMLQHRESVVTRKTYTTQTEDMIKSMDNRYDFNKIFIDAGAGSLGVGIFDHLLRDDNLKRKVVAINNRTRPLDSHGKKQARLLKEDLYDNLKSLMEKNKIRLLDDELVRASLRSVQYEYVTKPSQQSQLRIFGNYTHIVEGLIRAAWIVKEKNLNVWISSISV